MPATDQDLNKIARFFFIIFLDETVAIDSCHHAVKMFKQYLQKEKGDNSDVQLVRACLTAYKQALRNHRITAPHSVPSTHMQWPEGLDLSTWKEFIIKAPSKEILALVFSRLLKVSEVSIAKGLGVSTGLIRSRTASAISRIGQIEGRYLA